METKLVTSNSRSEEQETQLKRMLGKLVKSAIKLALREINPDKDGTQRLLGEKNKIGIETNDFFISQFQIRSVSNQCANEKVKSIYGYPLSYKHAGEDLDRQIAILQGLYPGLGGTNPDYLQKVKLGTIKVPLHAEKFFAIVNIWKNDYPTIFGTTYCEALLKVFDTIRETRNCKFENWLGGRINEKYIRQSVRTQNYFKQLSVAQGNPDILIIPAQFGIRHRGRSTNYARKVIANTPGEFGLGVFAVCIMILTHPERLADRNDLRIDCAGDELRSGTDGGFFCSPSFNSYNGEISLDHHAIAAIDANVGVISGFLFE